MPILTVIDSCVLRAAFEGVEGEAIIDNRHGGFSGCFFEETTYRTALLFWDEFES